MKVLHVSPHSVISGTERHILTLARGQMTRRVVVEVLMPLEGPLGDELRRSGIRVHVMDWRRRGLRRLVALSRLMRAGQYDVVHSHAYSRFPCLAAKIARAHGTVESRHIPGPKTAATPLNLRARLKHRLLNTCIDWLITVSDEIRETAILQGFPAARIGVIHNGISTDGVARASDPEARRRARAVFGVRDDQFVVGTAARLSPEKGVQTIIEAMGRVDNPKAVCVIIGDGHQREELLAATRALGLTERVRFLGYRNDVPELLPGFDCYVLASLYEGFSMGLLEALAAEVPPIVSDQPASCETIGGDGAGLTFATGDAADLAHAITRLLEDGELRRRTSRAAAERIKVFTLDAMVERTLAVYERVLTRRVGRAAPAAGAGEAAR